MNVIIIKVNDKVIGISKINDIPQSRVAELEKEIAINWAKKDEQVVALENEVSKLGEYCEELNQKINYLGKQIAIDRGEINADSEEEYVITIEKIKHEEPIEVSEEEDAYFEEKESEEHE